MAQKRTTEQMLTSAYRANRTFQRNSIELRKQIEQLKAGNDSNMQYIQSQKAEMKIAADRHDAAQRKLATARGALRDVFVALNELETHLTKMSYESTHETTRHAMRSIAREASITISNITKACESIDRA